MRDKGIPWFMRLTIQNSRTGQKAFAMYPCEKYEMLESLDWCQLPYGSGDYTHLSVSYNGVDADSLQETLTGIIENSEHPPSIRELNCLGELIQRMSAQTRSCLEQEIAEKPNAAIADAINAAYRLLSESVVYDGISMSDRAVLLGDDEPYIQVKLIAYSDDLDLDEGGIWVNCPAHEDELKAVAEQLDVGSYRDLEMGDVCAIVEKITTDMLCDAISTFDEINELARAMKEHGVIRELGKYKAILEFENCYDVGEAAELAGKLDDYEFYQGETLGEVGNRYRDQNPYDLDDEELAEDLGFEETHYGIVRIADGPKLEQCGLKLS